MFQKGGIWKLIKNQNQESIVEKEVETLLAKSVVPEDVNIEKGVNNYGMKLNQMKNILQKQL